MLRYRVSHTFTHDNWYHYWTDMTERYDRYPGVLEPHLLDPEPSDWLLPAGDHR